MKKAQIQMQETILVIFIVTVILIMGLIFFHKFQEKSILNEQNNYKITKLDNQLLTIPTQPELQCSKLSETENCIDITKLEAYKPRDLGKKIIKINIIYTEDTREWIIYNNPIGTNKLIRTSPISLYDPKTNKYFIGKLTVETYSI